jgi:Na+/proline symporter
MTTLNTVGRVFLGAVLLVSVAFDLHLGVQICSPTEKNKSATVMRIGGMIFLLALQIAVVAMLVTGRSVYELAPAIRLSVQYCAYLGAGLAFIGILLNLRKGFGK